MMLLKQRLSCAALSALMLLSLASCKKNPEKLLQSSREEQTTIMTIDGFDVPMELYRYVSLNYKEQFEQAEGQDIWIGEGGTEQLERLNSHVDETLIKLYTTLSLCRDYGIDPDSSFVKDTVERSMSGIYEKYAEDYQPYLDYLSSYYMNDSVYRFFVRNDILTEELTAEMIERGEFPTDKQTMLDALHGQDVIRVKQILVPFDNGKTAEENYAYAEKVLQDVRGGADFDALAQSGGAYGGDLFMFNNPDGYYISHGSHNAVFEVTAFSLEIGEISDIIETDAGYSILKRYEKEDAYLVEHFDELTDTYIGGLYNLALEEREKNLTVTDTDARADYTIFTMTMTED